MLILVTGGAASGKSALAERCAVTLGGRLLYIAAMEPLDAESNARVTRHRRQRAGLGFDTLECYRDLDGVRLDSSWNTALLECLGNLTANQMFSPGSREGEAAHLVWGGILSLKGQVENLVVVSNDVFGGGQEYHGETAAYIAALDEVNRRAAAMADLAIESVCGIPVILKGEGWMVENLV